MADTWSQIQVFRKRHAAFKSKLREKRRRREQRLHELELCEEVRSAKEKHSKPLLSEPDSGLERQVGI